MLTKYLNNALSGDIQSLVDASYKDFHAKGLDYICLKRTAEHTVKVYFFEGDATKIPEVVNPHDHRYPFRTIILAGSMLDYRYTRSANGDLYDAFDYYTPLNGGTGFNWRGEERLRRFDPHHLRRGSILWTAPEQLHTISILSDQAIIFLDQYGDVKPMNEPTSTWVRDGYPKPNTSGLYGKFTVDEYIKKIQVLRQFPHSHSAGD